MTSKINLTFLGTSDAIPSARRNHPAILLNYNEENILVDCGEGTQRQFRKAELNPNKVTRILITHWHGDHVLGIPGLLQTLSLGGYNKTLFIYGPKGTKYFMNNLLRTFVFVENYKIQVEEVEGVFFRGKDFYLEAKSMTHSIPCNAYSFIKIGQLRIDKAKLKKYKLPEGPLLKDLKFGKNIKYNGKIFKAKDLTYSDESKKISFILDSSFNDKMISFVKDSDILITESSFTSDLQDLAKEYGHLTAKQAGEIAKKSKSKELILTHISSRYDKNPKIVLDDAKKIFKNSKIVQDLDKIKI